MAKGDNLEDFLADIADAIREKKGSSDAINAQNFADEIKSIETSTPMWTGHVDVEGLKAIGWTDEDIAYYQEHGVNWDEEDDAYHKVSDDNKALYGVLTADNIQEYKDRIVWLPKIDFSNTKDFGNKFYQCRNMKGMPFINTSEVTYFGGAFRDCSNLSCAVPIDLSMAGTFDNMYRGCHSLQYVPTLELQHATSIESIFYLCSALTKVHLNITNKAHSVHALFAYCYSLKKIPMVDISNAGINSFVTECFCLEHFKFFGLNSSISFAKCYSTSKESIAYLINNEAATSPITITLHAAAYARLAEDPDIVAALNNHPLVSLASA